MLSRFFALFVLVGTTFARTATPPTAATVEVWPEGKMPGNGAKGPEAEVPRQDGFHRVTNVSRPTLTLFPAPRKAGAAAAPVMIVCPGGGYGYTVIDKEGSEIAAWLNSAGFSALVLKYRTPNNRAGALRGDCPARLEPRPGARGCLRRGRSSRNVSSSSESRASAHYPIQGSGTRPPARAAVAGEAGDARPVARAAPFAPADEVAAGGKALGSMWPSSQPRRVRDEPLSKKGVCACLL